MFGPLFNTTQRTCPIPRPRLSPPPRSGSGWVVPPSGTVSPPHRLTPTTCQRPKWMTSSSTTTHPFGRDTNVALVSVATAPLRASELKAGDDLLSPWTDYHRPRVLNGRVRDGNGCGHSGLVTGSTGVRLSGTAAHVYGGFVDDLAGTSCVCYAGPTGAGERTERPSDRLLVPVS